MPSHNCIKKSKRSKKMNVKRLLKKTTKSCSKTGNCYNNFVKKMGVYVINCKIHVSRLTKFRKYTKKANVKACRIPCIIGKNFTNELICNMIDKNLLKKSADMNAIEVSINMSHYNAWKRIVNSCLDYGLVMEDDTELHKDFVSRINEILSSLEEKNINFSILHLWNGNWQKTISKQKKVLKIDDDIQIMKETVKYNAGAVAYILSKEYAEFLLNNFFPIKVPNDILVGYFPRKGNHLTLKMRFDKKEECYKSPVLDNPCGGEEGTGESTRVSTKPIIREINCKKC